MNELSWCSAGPADAARLVELFRAIEQAAPVGLETGLDEVRARLSMPRLSLDRDTLIGTDAAGAPMVYAEAADMGVGQGLFRIRLTGATHPDLGEDDVRTTLDWLVQRARRLHRERSPGLPGVLGARCAAADRIRFGVLAEEGFEVVRWQQDLVRGVAQPLSSSAPSGGVAVAPYDSRYEEATRVAHNDAYADDPAALLPDKQDWPDHATGLPNFLPDASFLALADIGGRQEVAGFLFSLEHSDGTGVREGSLHCLGTRKPWRRRGLATALISHALAAFRVSGYATARLQVLSTNTDAVRLYTRLGFTDSGQSFAMLQAQIP
jgi:mycothiol synthase